MAAPTEFSGDLCSPAYAAWLDSCDPISGLRSRFMATDEDLIYLDGNSLGPLSPAVMDRVDGVMGQEWGRGLVRSWDQWALYPGAVGDLLAEHFLGARPGEVIISDSTSVNLYKLAMAAVDARPGRAVIVTDDDNFATDRYVLEGVAHQSGRELLLVKSDIVEGVDLSSLREAVSTGTALVCLSHVAYGPGAIVDMAEVNRICHDVGALVLWDLSHSVGSVPVHLEASGADLAVGCTYKYLNAGPGSPAFLYVRTALQTKLRQPIWGWFGQQDQFQMGPGYRPRPDITRFLVGTPPVIAIAAIGAGARLLAEVGIDLLRSKSVALTTYMIELADAWLAPLSFRLASPRGQARRGSHVSLQHPEAYRVSVALRQMANVIADYRSPDRLRLGPAPAYTRFVDVFEAMSRIRELVRTEAHLKAQLDDIAFT